MKVAEKASDRWAEVHILVEGKVNALEEFGQYIDKDKAICCYVPVEQGQKVKISGRLAGTTSLVAYDALVDGVLRKANSYSPKAVQKKSRKVDMEQFLFMTSKGIVDTDILVAPISRDIATRSEAVETIGTLELQLYVTRQPDISCALSGVKRYYTTSGNIEDGDSRHATFKLIAPDFQMSFEQNSVPVDNAKAGRERRKVDARRPGREPWAIFRFHYRSKDAITKHDLKTSYNPASKAKIVPHTLDLPDLPPLPMVEDSHTNDGDSSTRSSSPIAPDTLATPAKIAPKDTAAKTAASFTESQSNSATTPSTKLEMSSTTGQGPTADSVMQQPGETNIPAQVLPEPSTKPTPVDVPVRMVENSPTDNNTDSSDSKPHVDGNGNKRNQNFKDPIPMNKDHKTSQAVKQITGDNVFHQFDQQEQALANDTNVMASAKDTVVATSNESTVKHPSHAAFGLKPTNIAPIATMVPVKTPTGKVPQDVNQPIKKVPVKPLSISTTTTQMARMQPGVTTPPVTPTKREADPTDHTTTEPKRPKTLETSLAPTTPKAVSRMSSESSSPRPLSIERQVADQRKKLEAMRQKRSERVEKQKELDKKMEPYKKRMAEELERLSRELMQEEALALEDEEHLSASTEMLAEFGRIGDGQ